MSAAHSNGPTTDADWGRELRQLEAPIDPVDEHVLDEMYAAIRTRTAADDRSALGYLRSRRTRTRRAIAIVAFFGIMGAAVATLPLISAEERTGTWAATIAAFVALSVLTIFAATRPLHVPALRSGRTIAICAVAITATLVAALLPDGHAGTTADVWAKFAPCMGTGLLLGLPVYAVVRMLDRGNALGGLLAAAAAGLGGNLFLKLHCPIAEPSHMMAGHFSVAVIFVLGLGFVHWLAAKN